MAAYRISSGPENSLRKFLFITHTIWRTGERSIWSFLPPTTHLETAMQSTPMLLHSFLSNSKCLLLVLLGRASVSPDQVSSLLPSAVLLFTFYVSPPPCHLLVYYIYIHYTPTLHVIFLVIDTCSGWWQPRHNMLRALPLPQNEESANMKYPRPNWMRLGATWSTGGCSCHSRGCNDIIFKVPSNIGHAMNISELSPLLGIGWPTITLNVFPEVDF